MLLTFHVDVHMTHTTSLYRAVADGGARGVHGAVGGILPEADTLKPQNTVCWGPLQQLGPRAVQTTELLAHTTLPVFSHNTSAVSLPPSKEQETGEEAEAHLETAWPRGARKASSAALATRGSFIEREGRTRSVSARLSPLLMDIAHPTMV